MEVEARPEHDQIQEEIKESDVEQIYQLFKELLLAKRSQRAIEQRLFQTLSKSMHRKWMDERVLDQYKHEKMINEIVHTYLGRDIVLEGNRGTTGVYGSRSQEIFKRLEEVRENIQFITQLSQPIEDFKVYKMLNAIVNDEYIYQNRLIIILNDK